MPKLNDIPVCPAVPSGQSTDEVTRRYQIELITPMFGGGVETRTNDPSFPIRPTAIRGQLQFWWRATVGAQCTTRQDLRAAQSEIWGCTERASSVQVLVENVQAGERGPCALIEWNPRARGGQGGWRINWQSPFSPHDSALPYVLFPFQGETPPPNQNATIEKQPADCIRQASFQLILRCPRDLWPHVEPAVWAWVNFGGLGSRTRRGCGSIRCKALAPRDRDHLTDQLNRFAPLQSEAREWPTIGECNLLRTVEAPADPIRVWNWVIGRFRHFRQGEELGRNPRQPNSKRPGRSRFSEPETIRRVTGQRSTQHARLSHIPDDAFPRAEFGLPIVFHYQDPRRLGEPPDTVLYPGDDAEGKKTERMASPLILKPLALENGKAISLIVRLNTPSLKSVDLRQGDTSLPLPAPTLIRDARLSTYRDSPLAGSPNGSALEAFVAYASTQGFTEVTR